LDLPPVHLLTTADAVQQALPALGAAPVLGVDVETTGDGEGDALDPLKGRIRLVQLATPDAVYIVDCAGTDPRLLQPVFASGPVLLGHNVGFDLAFLQQAGLVIPNGDRLFDSMLAARVLEACAGPWPRYRLDDVAARWLGVQLDKSHQISDWSGTLSQEQLDYAARDAGVLLPLHARLTQETTAAGLDAVTALEMRCLPAVVWLELTGAPFDAAAWEPLSNAARTEEVRQEEAIKELLSMDINVRSTPQLLRVLQERGHAVTSTDEKTLQRLAAEGEPLAAPLLRYREAARRAGMYGIGFLAHVHPVTGRIHTDYDQLGSTAGRMSSRNPCLQNIPGDPAYRACFRPAPGRTLVKADYAGIELRLAAEIARPPQEAARALLADLDRRALLRALDTEQGLGSEPEPCPVP
jgi:DNA polymerase-1